MQSYPIHHALTPVRPDLHLVATKMARPAASNDRPMGFSRRELRRLVADMIG
jgi:hypothetical protein